MKKKFWVECEFNENLWILESAFFNYEVYFDKQNMRLFVFDKNAPDYEKIEIEDDGSYDIDVWWKISSFALEKTEDASLPDYWKQKFSPSMPGWIRLYSKNDLEQEEDWFDLAENFFVALNQYGPIYKSKETIVEELNGSTRKIFTLKSFGQEVEIRWIKPLKSEEEKGILYFYQNKDIGLSFYVKYRKVGLVYEFTVEPISIDEYKGEVELEKLIEPIELELIVSVHDLENLSELEDGAKSIVSFIFHKVYDKQRADQTELEQDKEELIENLKKALSKFNHPDRIPEYFKLRENINQLLK